MRTSPKMNPQWESGNDFPGAILDKSADLKYFTTVIAEEPCKTWMRIRPHTTPAKDGRTRRTTKTSRCGCAPKSAPATISAPPGRKSQTRTTPHTRNKNEPKRITFSDENAAEVTKWWHVKVREQNLAYVSTPKPPYRSLLGSGKHRTGSPLTPTKKLREGFWGPSRIRPTDIIPQVPKLPQKYLSPPELRPGTAIQSSSRRETWIDPQVRPYTAPSISFNEPVAQVSIRRFKSFYSTASNTRFPGYTSVDRFTEQRGSLDTDDDARQSRFGTLVRTVSSTQRMSSGERLLRERSFRSLERIRNFLINRGDKSDSALSSVQEFSQMSVIEGNETGDQDHFDSLFEAGNKGVTQESEEIEISQASDASVGLPRVMPFPPQFYRRRRNRGMYGIFPSDKPPPLPYTPPHLPPRLSSRMPNSRKDNTAKAFPWKALPRFV